MIVEQLRSNPAVFISYEFLHGSYVLFHKEMIRLEKVQTEFCRRELLLLKCNQNVYYLHRKYLNTFLAFVLNFCQLSGRLRTMEHLRTNLPPIKGENAQYCHLCVLLKQLA